MLFLCRRTVVVFDLDQIALDHSGNFRISLCPGATSDLRRDTARRLHEKAAWPIITRLALATISSTYASRQSHRSSL
jgi:hypothetical protein